MLAAGSVAAIGAATVHTSTAFADQGSGNCLPTNWPTSPANFLGLLELTQQGTGDDKYVKATVQPGVGAMASISCAPDNGTRQLSYKWGLTGPNGTRFNIDGNSVSAVNQNTWSARSAVRVVDNGRSNGLSTVGMFTVTLQVRVQCGTTQACWRCLTYVIPFEWSVGAPISSYALAVGAPTITFGSDDCNDTGGG